MNMHGDVEPQVAQGEKDPVPGVPVAKRAGRYFLILGSGMLLCAHGFAAIGLYPIGIVIMAAYILGLENLGDDVFAFSVGYGLHVLMLIAFLAAHNPRVLRYVTIVMVVFTLLNVAGCHMILHELSTIGN